MKHNIYDFHGTGKVFRFTLGQMLKAKGNIISLIIFFCFSLFSVPFMMIMESSEPTSIIHETPEEPDDTEPAELWAPSTIYIYTSFSSFPEELTENEYWSQVNVRYVYLYGGSLPGESLAPDEAKANISLPASGQPCIQLILPEDTLLGQEAQQLLQEQLTLWAIHAQLSLAGAADEQQALLGQPIESDYDSLSYYLDDKEPGSDLTMVQMLYSVLVMSISILAVTYIARCIIEEKSSKLVELLLISIRPLALIAGKILASMVYVCMMLLTMLAGYVISTLGCRLLVPDYQSNLAMITASIGQLTITPLTAIALIISLVLGIAAYALLAGLCGSGCSSVSEADKAISTPMMIIMFGYIISIVLGAFDNEIVAAVSSLIPGVSIFCAPLRFMSGDISFGILALSWLIQLLFVALLFRLCARVYNDLIIYNGTALKFHQILAMSRRRKEVRR